MLFHRRLARCRLHLQQGLRILLAATLAAPLGVLAATAELPLPTRVERLEKLLAANGLVELLRQVEALQQEVRALRGEIENQAYTIDQLRSSQRDTYTDVDGRLVRLEQGGVTATAPGVIPALSDAPLPTTLPPAGSNVAGTPSDQSIAVDMQGNGPGVEAAMTPPVTPSGEATIAAIPPGVPSMPGAPGTMDGAINPQGPLVPPTSAVPAGAAMPTVDSPESEAAYRTAFGLLKAGQYEQSIQAFSAYLQRYPASQYNDNAQYWIGEAYYVMDRYEPAIAEYQKVVTNFPNSQKQSPAMLKIAYSYDALGLKEQAITVLSQLKQRYPDSVAASLADERLRRMQAGQP